MRIATFKTHSLFNFQTLKLVLHTMLIVKHKFRMTDVRVTIKRRLETLADIHSCWAYGSKSAFDTL